MNQSQIGDFLGRQGGAPLPWLPVVTIADFSDTAVGEFIEARGLVASNGTVTGANGRFATFILESAGPGGCVISDLSCAIPTLPNSSTAVVGTRLIDSWGVSILAGTIATVAGAGAIAPVEVGSLSPNSRAGQTLVNTTALVPAPVNFISGTFRLQPGTRWFVPPGSILVLQCNAARGSGNDIDVEFEITWRELAPVTRGS